MTHTVSTSTHDVVATPLTRDGFAPFGELVSAAGRRPLTYDLYEGRDDTFVAGLLDSDHPVELLLLRSQLREFQVRFLERHHAIAQAFLPLGGDPYLTVVAAAERPLINGLPAPSDIHAFICSGDEGVVLRRGTWHEPPFTLVQGGMTLVTSHRTLTEALGSTRDEHGEITCGDVEKLSVTHRTGRTVRVQLP